MKILLVYGNCRRGSTYHCVQILREALEKLGEFEFQEVWLPRQLPQHCCGCFNCILRGEEKCPHYQEVAPIAQALLQADGVILSSPVYGLDLSGPMKTFIDHLCYLWIPHRPRPQAFSKVGMVISTTAGMGIGRTTKSMSLALKYMGFCRIFTWGTAVAASSWEEVNPKKKQVIKEQLDRRARAFARALQKRPGPPLFTRFLFGMMRKVISGYPPSNIDRVYWGEQGWLAGASPFREEGTPQKAK